MIYLLDTGVLGTICHPKGATACASWFLAMLDRIRADAELLVPEIADYELRRELIRKAIKERRDTSCGTSSTWCRRPAGKTSSPPPSGGDGNRRCDRNGFNVRLASPSDGVFGDPDMNPDKMSGFVGSMVGPIGCDSSR